MGLIVWMWSSILAAYTIARIRLWWLMRPFRKISPYVAPMNTQMPTSMSTDTQWSAE